MFALYYFLTISILCCRCGNDKNSRDSVYNSKTLLQYINIVILVRLEGSLGIDSLYYILQLSMLAQYH